MACLHTLAKRLPILWFKPFLAWPLHLLLPFSYLFGAIVRVRRALYRAHILRSGRLAVPLIVVGNITAGGSGKTPLVLWLARELIKRGWRPAIISRGYGRSAEHIQAVHVDSLASEVGDEPLLLARETGVPVWVGRQRLLTAEALLKAHPDCSILISDDGLQHYPLARDVEIVVFDGRAAGNQHLLPAGPLREGISRLHSIDAEVWNLPPDTPLAPALGSAPRFIMHLHGTRFVRLNAPHITCSADDLRTKRLYAIAGIGNPARFFSQLRRLNLHFSEHPFPDHHVYRADDLHFAHDGALLMTAKDAVKCAKLIADHTYEAWVLPVEASVAASSEGTELLDLVVEKLNGHAFA